MSANSRLPHDIPAGRNLLGQLPAWTTACFENFLLGQLPASKTACFENCLRPKMTRATVPTPCLFVRQGLCGGREADGLFLRISLRNLTGSGPAFWIAAGRCHRLADHIIWRSRLIAEPAYCGAGLLRSRLIAEPAYWGADWWSRFAGSVVADR